MPSRLFRNVRMHLASNGMAGRVRSAFEPRKPRNALMRVVVGLLGLGLLALLLVFGLFVGAAMLAAGLLVRLWRGRGKPIIGHRARQADPRIVDGEYRVVRKPVLPQPR